MAVTNVQLKWLSLPFKFFLVWTSPISQMLQEDELNTEFMRVASVQNFSTRIRVFPAQTGHMTIVTSTEVYLTCRTSL